MNQSISRWLPVVIGGIAITVVSAATLLVLLKSTPHATIIKFEDVSGQAGISAYRGESYGSAWRDYDNDGCPDIFVSNHRFFPTLYKNNCDGTFTDTARLLPTDFGHLDRENPAWKSDMHGAAWADFDNDGDADLITAAGGARGKRTVKPSTMNRVYRNDDGLFNEVSRSLNLGQGGARGRTPHWFDFDRDGRLDIVLNQSDPMGWNDIFHRSSGPSFQPCDGALVEPLPGRWKNEFSTVTRLFDDDRPVLIFGDTRFPSNILEIREGCRFRSMNIETAASVNGTHDFAIADLDGDLRPDIFVVTRRFSAQVLRAPNGVYVADYVSADRPLDLEIDSGASLTAIIEDGRGWPNAPILAGTAKKQLSVTKDTSERRHAVVVRLTSTDTGNHGVAGNWSEIGIHIGYEPKTGTWRVRARPPTSSSIDVLFKGAAKVVVRDQAKRRVNEFGRPDALYMAAGFSLENRIDAFEMDDALTGCSSAGAGDFDNDMDVDLYLLCHERLRNSPNRLYDNIGRRRFVDVAQDAGAEGSTRGVGDHVSIGDYDNDGFLDLFIGNGANSRLIRDGHHQLLRNRGNSNRWVKFKLTGTISNRDAYGARVFVTANGVTQVREHSGGMRRNVQDSQIVHFGLGPADLIDRVIVEWPSGAIERFAVSDPNQLYQLTEGSNDPATATDNALRLLTGRDRYKLDDGIVLLALADNSVDRETIEWTLRERETCGPFPVCRLKAVDLGDRQPSVSARLKNGVDEVIASTRFTVID